MFAEDALTEDRFLGGRLRVLQPVQGYRAAMDPVLLAAAVPAVAGQTVLELGCGAGVALLCLAARVRGPILTGVELQPDYADLARRNAALNGVAMQVVQGDLAALPAGLRAQSFDHVIANPPYFPAKGGTKARDAGRETALREHLPLTDWLAVGMRRLKPGGWLTMILLAERLPDLLAGLAGTGTVGVLPLAPRADQPANRVVVRVKKAGRGAFTLLAPLILHDGPAHDGDRDTYSGVARAVLRDAAALPWRD